MSSAPMLSKLAELRAKTDQQLARLIENQLERGLRLARIHIVSPSNLARRESARLSAEQAYSEARKLLFKVDDPGERRRLEGKLDELREILNTKPAQEQLRVRTACS